MPVLRDMLQTGYVTAGLTVDGGTALNTESCILLQRLQENVILKGRLPNGSSLSNVQKCPFSKG
jgi:hypothetical protein